jgi:uncharacterized protein YecE (DUF72 family)
VTRIGCAGWSIPKPHRNAFPAVGSHLQRYARRFNCVEINSSFYRPHRPTSYARWAASVPGDFQFAVKAPRLITHDLRLVGTQDSLDAFLSQIASLGPKLGPLLFQLPPSFAFTKDIAEDFFTALRTRFEGQVVCEPRHTTWFTDTADDSLAAHRIARAAADPAVTPRAARPGGWDGLVYHRLHGTPRMYYSSYGAEILEDLADRLRRLDAHGTPGWCIFDNTAAGAATENAIQVQDRLAADTREPAPLAIADHPAPDRHLRD